MNCQKSYRVFKGIIPEKNPENGNIFPKRESSKKQNARLTPFNEYFRVSNEYFQMARFFQNKPVFRLDHETLTLKF